MLLNEALDLPFRQPEVDFVIPNLNEDLRLYVDPFLFFKSLNPEYQAVHGTLHRFFEVAVRLVREGDLEVARRMMVFPEVRETMIGMSVGGHRGRGMGDTRGTLIYDELVANPVIQERGVRHIAEMQILIEGVGPDMISDMCTNIAKSYFVAYTQRQAALHGIPVEGGLALEHFFDWEDLSWDDVLVDLPANPVTGEPILLVPKNVVRRFVDLNYRDLWMTTYRYVLREQEIQRSLQSIGEEPRITWKEIEEKYGYGKSLIVRAVHEDPQLLDDYLDEREKDATEEVEPERLATIDGADHESTPPATLIAELRAIDPGRGDARRYEQLLLRILHKLFSPHLADPHSQVTTHDEREVIDITFYNAADRGFWADMKQRHDAQLPVFELKNMTDLGNEEFAQLVLRLDDSRGKFGVLVSREADGLDLQRAYRRWHNDRKVLLSLTDESLIEMLEASAQGLQPTMVLQRLYRTFMERA